MLVETYGEYALIIGTCETWFRKFKSGDFEGVVKDAIGINCIDVFIDFSESFVFSITLVYVDVACKEESLKSCCAIIDRHWPDVRHIVLL